VSLKTNKLALVLVLEKATSVTASLTSALVEIIKPSNTEKLTVAGLLSVNESALSKLIVYWYYLNHLPGQHFA